MSLEPKRKPSFRSCTSSYGVYADKRVYIWPTRGKLGFKIQSWLPGSSFKSSCAIVQDIHGVHKCPVFPDKEPIEEQDLRSHFPTIKAEFLKSYSRRGGKLTDEEQELHASKACFVAIPFCCLL